MSGLFGASPMTVQYLATAMIRPDPRQPRRDFDQEALAELAESIAENGILSPILVTATDAGYQIVYGERRWRAAQMIGLQEMPCIVGNSNLNIQSGAGDRKIVQLAENAHHRDLADLEYVDAIGELSAQGWTTEAIAKKTGKRCRWVKLVLELAHNLPMRALLESSRISSVEVYAHFSGLPAEARRELLDAGGKITSVDCARMREKYRQIQERKQCRLELENAGSASSPSFPPSPRVSTCDSGGDSALGDVTADMERPGQELAKNAGGKDDRPSSGVRKASNVVPLPRDLARPLIGDLSLNRPGSQEDPVPDKDEVVLHVRISRQSFDELMDPEYLERLCQLAIEGARQRGWPNIDEIQDSLVAAS